MSHKHKCFVPNCTNSVAKTRDKVFVHVNDFLKRKWCRQLNLEYKPLQRLYCCEDHFNLKEDLENYYQWKLMKAAPKLKPSTILRCSQENIPINKDEPSFLTTKFSASTQPVNDTCFLPTRSSTSTQPVYYKQIDASTQSEPVKIQMVDKASQPLKIKMVDKASQPLKIKMVDKSTLANLKPKQKCKPNHIIIHEESDATISASPSMYGFTSDTDVSQSDVGVVVKSVACRNVTIHLINKNPQMYLGLPNQYIYLIKEIAQKMGGKDIEILLTLIKIRLNDSLTRLAEMFDITRPTATKYFESGVAMLANYFQHLVYMPTPLEIKRNLPLVFKTKYSKVQCIIDGFEIEIEKPSNAESQAQTWSQYKHCNTLKYIVGCTPNGFISYISKGYGGRTSDKALIEIGDLIDCLHENSVIMADRGFKEIESLLISKNIRLLRPPSVYSNIKPTKEDVIQTKVIASLRVHVERVIRRLREFRLLKPHSVVNHKHVGYMDEIVLICCGLINLQNEIIKQ